MFLGAFWTTIAAVLGLLTVLAIVGDPDNHGGQAGPFDLAYLIFVLPIIAVAALHPHRRQLYRIGGAFRGRRARA
jgi:hypothetical protein